MSTVNVGNLIAGPGHSVLLHSGPKDAAGNAQPVVPGNVTWAVVSGGVVVQPQANYNVDASVTGTSAGPAVVTATANGPGGPQVATFNVPVVTGPFDHFEPSADVPV